MSALLINRDQLLLYFQPLFLFFFRKIRVFNLDKEHYKYILLRTQSQKDSCKLGSIFTRHYLMQCMLTVLYYLLYAHSREKDKCLLFWIPIHQKVAVQKRIESETKKRKKETKPKGRTRCNSLLFPFHISSGLY